MHPVLFNKVKIQPQVYKRHLVSYVQDDTEHNRHKCLHVGSMLIDWDKHKKVNKYIWCSMMINAKGKIEQEKML